MRPLPDRRTARPPTERGPGDRGAVTVEAAVALSAFIAVLAMVLSGMSAVLDQIRCTDAAREAARLIARGDPARVTDAVKRIGPRGAAFSIHVHDDEVTVDVAADNAADLLPGITVGARAYAVAEPAVEHTAAPPTGNGGR